MIRTKFGDEGYTLIKGEPVLKFDTRVEALGTVDEAMAFIGWLIHITSKHSIDNTLLHQANIALYEISAIIASYGEYLGTASFKDVSKLEEAIQDADLKIEVFTMWYMTEISSAANLARTAVRRAERAVVKYTFYEGYSEEDAMYMIRYVNALSDYLYILAEIYN